MKIGCVIQGDVRRGTNYVLEKIPSYFDYTVLSTWKGDDTGIKAQNLTIVTSEKPSNAGISNRNLQRLTTARGIKAAKEVGCDYILKWRTDMLPTNLDIDKLLDWANYRIPAGMSSRLVMPAFRNLSVDPDWLSSIPDLFAFGHISAMEMLWGDDKIDYSRNMNLPERMLLEMRPLIDAGLDLSKLYMAESELYAIYKSRLEEKLCADLNHRNIACDNFRLIDYRDLEILWFGKSHGFRSVGQAWEHPWWTVAVWKNGGVMPKAYRFHVSSVVGNLSRAISSFRIKFERLWQAYLWRKYNKFKI